LSIPGGPKEVKPHSGHILQLGKGRYLQTGGCVAMSCAQPALESVLNEQAPRAAAIFLRQWPVAGRHIKKDLLERACAGWRNNLQVESVTSVGVAAGGADPSIGMCHHSWPIRRCRLKVQG
jgi:hypothetical protein